MSRFDPGRGPSEQTTNRSRIMASKTRSKPARTMYYNATCGVLFLHIHRPGEEETAYYVDPVPSDLGGRGFELAKIRDSATVYHVHVGGKDSCECKGFLRWARCKHIDACRLLVQTGRV